MAPPSATEEPPAPAEPVARASSMVSSRARGVPSFVVMDVMAAAAAREAEHAAAGETRRVLHLEVGQPASGAPEAVRRAARRALDDPSCSMGYTLALGSIPLRTKIADMYRERYGVRLGTENIAITTGSSGAFVAAFTCLFDVGDRVCCPVPGYPCYRNILTAIGVEVVMLPTSQEDRFAPTIEAIEAEMRHGKSLAGLILASPGNPSGYALSREKLLELASFCEAHSIVLIVDEIYHGIGKRLPSALEVSQKVVVVSSFSKYWSMPGWRLGYLISRDTDMMGALERLLQNMHISAPSLSQKAALAAFDCDEELQGHVERYRTNTKVLLSALPGLGFDGLQEPDGAFYLYAEVSRVLQRRRLSSSVGLCKEMLQVASVAATPGVDFDPLRGERYVRFSVAGSVADIAEASSRLTSWLSQDKS